MATKDFIVFDSDGPRGGAAALWRMLDPEYRTLGKHALWRQEGRATAYLRSTGEMFRDKGNPTCRATHCGGRAWTGMRSSAVDPRVKHPATEGSFGLACSYRRHGCDGGRSDAVIPDVVR